MRALLALLLFAPMLSAKPPQAPRPPQAPPVPAGWDAPALPTDPNQPAPAGHQWVRRGDGPWKLELMAPEVAAPKGSIFPAAGKHDGHSCPTCGRSQYVVDSFNRDGTHNHRCDACGHSWKH